MRTSAREGQVVVNRTGSFVNLNRFKSGRAIKRLNKITYDKCKKKAGKEKGRE